MPLDAEPAVGRVIGGRDGLGPGVLELLWAVARFYLLAVACTEGA
jgi:hypothetical protein